MAKAEARRFFGITGRGMGRNGIFLVALLTTIGGLQFLEPYVDSRLFHDWLGWTVLVGFAAVSALLFLLLKVFGIDLWGRRRNGFIRYERAGQTKGRPSWRKMVMDLEALAAAHGVDGFHFRSSARYLGPRSRPSRQDLLRSMISN
jgi:hypothetical protein